MAGPPFVFRDYRGLLQLRLNTTDDLDHLHRLEPARWSSTSVPIDQLFCDKAFLEFIDTDKNKRVRVQELLEAHDWMRTRLKNKRRMIERTDTIFLDDLDTSNPDAAKLKALVEEHMDRKGGGVQVALEEIRAFKETYTKQFPNGDGVVTFAQMGDLELSALASNIVKSEGGVPDLSGEIGIDETKLDAFIQHGLSWLAWEAEANTIDSEVNSTLFPLGEATVPAGELVLSLSEKLDQFFSQCDLISQENAALSRFSATPETLAALNINDPAAIQTFLKEAPIARPNPEGILDIEAWLNPLFADDLKKLAALVLPLVPAIKKRENPNTNTKISRKEWAKIRELFGEFRAYMQRKPPDMPDELRGDELRELILGPLPERLRFLIAEDREASKELKAISDLEKLALYQRWLVELANNMASFPYLFVLNERCLFETGTLILDGRELSFCVRVNQKSEHKAIAEQANLFVIYADLDRKSKSGETETMSIAAAVTSGVRRGISMGKRGIFYDREGREWDARIVDIIVRPISLWEAAVAPFVRLRDFVLDRIERWTESRFVSAESRALETGEGQVLAPDALAAPRPPGAASDPAAQQAQRNASNAQSLGLANLFFGSAISLAAIGSAAAFAIKTLSLTDPVNLLVVVCGIVGGIMLLSAFLGWLRLRKRDLSTLLEACGWAFNVRILLRRRHSLRFTRIPPIPRKAVRERGAMPRIASDDSRTSSFVVILALLLICLLIAAFFYRAPFQAWLGSLFHRGAP